MAGNKKQHPKRRKKKVHGRETNVGKPYLYFGEYQEKLLRLSHSYIKRTGEKILRVMKLK